MQQTANAYFQDHVAGYNGVERRTRRHVDRELIEEVVRVARDSVVAIIAPPLSEDEQRWVRLAIQREAQSIKLRQAVIEKTLAGLVWVAIVGLGVILFEYLKSHGFDLTIKK